MATVSVKDLVEMGRLSEKLKNDLRLVIEMLNSEDNQERTMIHYRWYYKDDQKTFGIEETRNVPGVRWLLYETALENPGKFGARRFCGDC